LYGSGTGPPFLCIQGLAPLAPFLIRDFGYGVEVSELLFLDFDISEAGYGFM
jgi:hypothetical protein